MTYQPTSPTSPCLPEQDTHSMDVIIIGEGPTGLLLAQGLKQAGIHATIYEHKSTRIREWGQTMQQPSAELNSLLPAALRARLSETWCDPFDSQDASARSLPHYEGGSGELLFTTPAPHEVRVSRVKMEKLFGEGIDIHYGKRLISISSGGKCGVTAIFQDGTTASGALIVGCDGARSMTRELLVGYKDSALQNLPDINVFNFVCKFRAETARRIRAQHPVAFNTYSRNNCVFWVSIQDIPDPEDAESWEFRLFFSWSGAPGRDEFENQASRIEFLRSKAGEYAEPWRTILTEIPGDADFGVDHIGIFNPPDWSDVPLDGRVTLAGDAAKSLSPYRGQGLNSGVKDSALLVEHLTEAEQTEGGWVQAVKDYGAALRARAAKEVPISEDAALIAHDFERLTNQSSAVGANDKDVRPELRGRNDSVTA